MASDIEYAKMIEIPISTCEYKPKKKRSIFRKKWLISAINGTLDKNEQQGGAQEFINEKQDLSACDEQESKQRENLPAIITPDSNKKFNAIISAQVVAVFALVCAIILTNVFWENSGMNTLFKSVFKTEQIQTDNRTYGDFTLYLPVASEGVTVTGGVIEIAGEHTLYPVCEGKITSVERSGAGTYTLTVTHSESFSSVVEGLNYVYYSVGDEVTRNLPLGYVNEQAKVYLYNGESLLTDYATVENTIVFNK